MDQIKPTLSQFYTYASKCIKCMKSLTIFDQYISVNLAEEYLIFVIVVICYLIIAVPALRRTDTCDIIVIFITCTFLFMRITSLTSIIIHHSIVPSIILSGIFAFILINPSIKRYVEIFSDVYIVMIGIEFIKMSFCPIVQITIIAICGLCYLFFIFYIKLGNMRICIRALTCSLLIEYLVSTGYFSFLTFNWMGMLGFIDGKWEFYIIKAGFVLLAVLHFLLFKYTEKFYVEEDRKSLMPQ